MDGGLFRTRERRRHHHGRRRRSTGRGFFDNAGDTLRQGIELGARYHGQRLMAYANYALRRRDVPDAHRHLVARTIPRPRLRLRGRPIRRRPDDPICVQVNAGDRMPGIPRHRFKAGFDYWMTPKWKFGADLVAASDQIFFGDEGNDNAPLAGYAKVDLHSSYDVTENIQIYGLDQEPVRRPLRPVRQLLQSRGGEQRGGGRSRRRAPASSPIRAPSRRPCPSPPMAA